MFAKPNSLTDNQLFWVLQISVWLALGPVWYSMYALAFGQTELPYLIHPMVQSILGIFVSWPMRYVFHWTWDKPAVIKFPSVIFAVLFFSFLWTLLRLVTFIWISGETKNFLPEFGLWYFPGLLVFTCWAALYHVFRYYRLLQSEHALLMQMAQEKQAEKLRRKNAEHLAQEAKLRMLRYQLNPHFLFNTMNAITSLVNAHRNAEASRMIDALSSFLRDSLEGDPLRRVTLGAEIASLENYLGIEKARFADRLEMEIDVSDQDLDFKVPGLLLQPLAENVIKHAVRAASKTVKMTVSVRADQDFLDIVMTDTGPGISGLVDGELPATGIGLKNVRDRLQNLYGNTYRFELESEDGAGLRVMIRIPAEKEFLGSCGPNSMVADA